MGNLLYPIQSLTLGINVDASKKKIKDFLHNFVMANNFHVSNVITKEHILSNIYENLDYLHTDVFVETVKGLFYLFPNEVENEVTSSNGTIELTKAIQSNLIKIKDYLVNTNYYDFNTFINTLTTK